MRYDVFNSVCFFFFKHKTAYEMRISDWSSDVCSSDLDLIAGIDRSLQHVIDPADPWLKQEAIQQMAMSLSQGYAPIMAQDSRVPAFFTFLNPVIKSAAPNPDYMYRTCFVEGSGTSPVSGPRGTTPFGHTSEEGR